MPEQPPSRWQVPTKKKPRQVLRGFFRFPYGEVQGTYGEEGGRSPPLSVIKRQGADYHHRKKEPPPVARAAGPPGPVRTRVTGGPGQGPSHFPVSDELRLAYQLQP